MQQAVLYAFAGLAVLGALVSALAESMVRSVFAFFLCLFSIAGLYVFAGAPFIALTQVMVYVGGILVLLIFGVMLSTKEGLTEVKPSFNSISISSVALGMVCLLLALVLYQEFGKMGSAVIAPTDTTSYIGVQLMGRYLLPFELISILLLLVLLGAVFISRKKAV